MEKSKVGRGYDAIPAKMVIPAVPTFAEDWVPRSAGEQTIEISGAKTLPACVAPARRHANELLRRCWHQLRLGNRVAIQDLLDDNPSFILVPWVAEEFSRLLKGGLLHRKRGRPRGSWSNHPLVIVGLVRHLLRTRQARTLAEAFRQLDDLGIAYETARKSYYQAEQESRFQAVMLEFPERAGRVEPPMGAEVLAPGREVVRSFDDPQFGPAQIVIKGL